MASPQRIATLNIANGATDSAWLTRDDFGRCRSLSIQCLAAALTGTITIQTNSKQDGTGTTTTVQSPPGTDITIAALKAVPLTSVAFLAIRVHSSGAEGGSRDFEVIGEVGE